MTTSVGHAALMKSTLKPGFEFDQLLVLGILVICSFHSMPYWAYAIVPVFVLFGCVAFISSILFFVLRMYPYCTFDSYINELFIVSYKRKGLL